MKAFFACFVLVALHGAAGDQASLTCPLRQVGLDFAAQLQPWRPQECFRSIAAALNGSPEAVNCSVSPKPVNFKLTAPSVGPEADKHESYQPCVAMRSRVIQFPLPSRAGELVFFVDPSATRGSDVRGNGSLYAPFLSIRRAVTAVREARSAACVSCAHTTAQASLVLRAGTFFLGSNEQGGGPLQLTPADSHITFQAFPGEEVFISGGTALTGVTWQPSGAPARAAYDFRPGSLSNGFDVAPPGNNITLVEALQQCSAIAECAAIGFGEPVEPRGRISNVVFKAAAMWSCAPESGSVYVKNVRCA